MDTGMTWRGSLIVVIERIGGDEDVDAALRECENLLVDESEAGESAGGDTRRCEIQDFQVAVSFEGGLPPVYGADPDSSIRSSMDDVTRWSRRRDGTEGRGIVWASARPGVPMRNL